MSSDVIRFYKNKNILLTGGTGFFGKMIIEKLLRTCDVNMIYVIVRPKKGFTPKERLQNLFEEPVFEKVRAATPKYINKVHTLEGNLSKKNLGLSEEDKEIIKNEVNIVFHCGASLNMDSKLSEAVMTNVRGTSAILDLIGKSKNLKAFILVSTAYSNCYESHIEEKFYEPPINPDLLIKMVEELHPNILNGISSGLIGKWPNSYVFTKAVAENLIISKGHNIPVALFRPTIVTSTAFEPVSGWSDNLYGPVGILLSSYCGILRVIQADGNIKSHTVPGDMCINALLCLAWHVDKKCGPIKTEQKKAFPGLILPTYGEAMEVTASADIHEHYRIIPSLGTRTFKKMIALLWNSSIDFIPPVMNFSAKNTKLLIPMKQYVKLGKIDYAPFKRAIWCQMLFMIKNRNCYILMKFLLHTVPAYLIDSLLILSLKKPKMKRIYSKLEKTSDVLRYFLLREWVISNEQVKELWNKLSDEDRKIFNFNIDSIDLDSYFKNMISGMKKYILKEDMTKLKLHKERYNRLTILHYTLKYSVMGFGLYSVYKYLYIILNRRKR